MLSRLSLVRGIPPLRVNSSNYLRDLSHSIFPSKSTPSRSELTKLFSSEEAVWFFSKLVSLWKKKESTQMTFRITGLGP